MADDRLNYLIIKGFVNRLPPGSIIRNDLAGHFAPPKFPNRHHLLSTDAGKLLTGRHVDYAGSAKTGRHRHDPRWFGPHFADNACTLAKRVPLHPTERHRSAGYRKCRACTVDKIKTTGRSDCRTGVYPTLFLDVNFVSGRPGGQTISSSRMTA